MAVNFDKFMSILRGAVMDDSDKETPEADTTVEETTDEAPVERESEPESESETESVDTDTPDEESIPDSEITVAELQATCERLGAENETLRNRIAELEGDIIDTDADEPSEYDHVDDNDVNYSDDDAQTDIDAQIAAIAKLSGNR